MRLFIVLAALLWIIAVAVPSVAGVVEWWGWSSSEARAAAGLVGTGDANRIIGRGRLIVEGGLWALAVAIPAVVVGWPVGRALRAALADPRAGVRRRGVLLAIGTLAPLCLPAYLVSWAWWQAAPPGSWLGDFAVRSGAVVLLRGATLWLGLLCWSWPIVAWCVIAAGRPRPDAHDAMALDRAGRPRRLALAWWEDARGLLLGAVITAIFVFGNTTAFDIAQIRSFGFELRTLEVRGAAPGAVLAAAAPAIGFMITGAVLVMLLARGSAAEGRTPRGLTLIPSWVVLGLAAGVPLAIVAARLPWRSGIGTFLLLYGDALATTVIDALLAGALGSVVALGAFAAAGAVRRSVRVVHATISFTWIVAGVLPATVVVAAMIAAFNRPDSPSGAGLVRSTLDSLTTLGNRLYDGPLIVPLAHLTLFGMVGAVMGTLAARAEGRAQRDLAIHDGATSLRAFMAAHRPGLVAAGFATLAIVAALSLGEVVVAGRLQPPGRASLASSILNAIHYQHPETVMFAVIVLILTACAAALLAVAAWRPLRRGAALTLAVTAVASGSGCTPDGEIQPLPTNRMFGAPGTGLGQFDYPRAIASDPRNGFVYVIDKTARVQRFGSDGTPQHAWRMPEWALGKPTGITVDDDGFVWVADTHYHRVIRFDREGNEQMRFGRYGTGPGEFVYLTDVALGADGRIYVSEYGGNDRVQVFSSDGEYLFTMLDGGVLSRPQSIAFSPDGQELYVADAVNHRIVVVDPEGRPLRELGGAGVEPGTLHYPYGLEVLDDGSLLVAEFGGNRVQRLSPEGRSIERWGGPGFERGRVRFPWGVAADSSTIFVLDSGNSRVQAFPRE